MTKEEWLKVKSEPEIPLGVWFSFYREMGGTYDDPIYFEEAFVRAARGMTIRSSNGTLTVMNRDTARRQLSNYYDTIYQL